MPAKKPGFVVASLPNRGFSGYGLYMTEIV